MIPKVKAVVEQNSRQSKLEGKGLYFVLWLYSYASFYIQHSVCLMVFTKKQGSVS